jgi:16S rRNA (adenine1518-N6/adenine1519-N6)-dimethyltransferase
MNTIKDRLRAMGIRPSKLKGQNFLADDFFIEQIIQFGAPRSTEHLVEIGPGLGALTAELARFPKLTLIEIEPKLCRIMATRYPKAEVINADACTVDFSTIGTNLTLFGNLPYAFSTDIMMNVVGQARSLSRAVFLLQKEYAQRLAAAPGYRRL